MKTNEAKKALIRFLRALAFSTAALAAVYMLSFVWLVGIVYRDNIRGYVPAGLTGMMIFGVAWLVLVFRLSEIAKRRQDGVGLYVLGGCLAGPAALCGFAIYTGLLIRFLGAYSWQKDVAVSSIGAAVCLVASIKFHQLWLKEGRWQKYECTERIQSLVPQNGC